MTSFLDIFAPYAAPAATSTASSPAAGNDAPAGASSAWSWASRLLGLAPVADAQAGQVTAASVAAPVATTAPVVGAATPAPAPAPVTASVSAAATLPLQALRASGSIRASAIPAVQGGRTTVVLARGMSTYRQVAVPGGAAGRTIAIPAARDAGAAKVEVFAVQPHRVGEHATQVLVPVSGTRVRVPAGATVRFVVRVTGRASGTATVNAGVAKIGAKVASATVRPLPMMTWVNPASAQQRGASVAQVERTLAGFGVASTGTVAGRALPRRYVSAAWEAATKQPIGPVVDRILAEERATAASAPGAAVWVQVSDEQDTTAAKAAATARWIAKLDAELERRGSRAKLFVACQPRPHTRAYAPYVDGWAVTQSSAGQTRAQSMAAVRENAARTGRRIELMEYPGNAFFDGSTAGSAALSTASAALDGAGSWFSYSANNLDVLEAGKGVEGRGDIGGLVAIQKGKVLPTLALAEADYGANLGAAARALGGDARSGAAAKQVRAAATQLDAYRHGDAPDLAAWERAIGAALA